MNTFKVLKGFFVLAIAFVGFAPAAATSASMLGTMAGAAYAPCPATIASGGSLPSGQTSSTDCTAAEPSAYSQMTGTYLPGMAGGDSLAAEPSLFGQMTGTYLPGMAGGSASLTAVTSVSAAAPVVSCLATLHRDLETVLPNGWSEAQACDTVQAMGLGAQANIVPATSALASDFCQETLHQELGTVLPSGLTNAQACNALQYVQAAQQNGVIPVTGGQADPTDPVACWHDAGASICQR